MRRPNVFGYGVWAWLPGAIPSEPLMSYGMWTSPERPVHAAAPAVAATVAHQYGWNELRDRSLGDRSPVCRRLATRCSSSFQSGWLEMPLSLSVSVMVLRAAAKRSAVPGSLCRASSAGRGRQPEHKMFGREVANPSAFNTDSGHLCSETARPTLPLHVLVDSNP
jgi:hypothetical protein